MDSQQAALSAGARAGDRVRLPDGREVEVESATQWGWLKLKGMAHPVHDSTVQVVSRTNYTAPPPKKPWGLHAAVIRLAASHETASPLRRALLAAMFPSAFGIGEAVWVSIQDQSLHGQVRSVRFTESKVLYSVDVETSDGPTTFHDIDSVFVRGAP